MSFKNLVSSIKRAGSFFHLTSIDYPTLVEGVTDLDNRLDSSEEREAALLRRVEVLEQSAHQAVGVVTDPNPKKKGFSKC